MTRPKQGTPIEVDCSKCGGLGEVKVVCERCEGEGTIERDSDGMGGPHQCGICDGSGKETIPCDKCEGHGKIMDVYEPDYDKYEEN